MSSAQHTRSRELDAPNEAVAASSAVSSERQILAALPSLSVEALQRISTAANTLALQQKNEPAFANYVRKLAESPLKQLLTAAQFVGFNGNSAVYDFPAVAKAATGDTAATGSAASSAAMRLTARSTFTPHDDYGCMSTDHSWMILRGDAADADATSEENELFALLHNTANPHSKVRIESEPLRKWLATRGVVSWPWQGEDWLDATVEDAQVMLSFIYALFAPAEAARRTCRRATCAACSLHQVKDLEHWLSLNSF